MGSGVRVRRGVRYDEEPWSIFIRHQVVPCPRPCQQARAGQQAGVDVTG